MLDLINLGKAMVKDCSLENWALEGIDILFMMIVRNSMCYVVCVLFINEVLVSQNTLSRKEVIKVDSIYFLLLFVAKFLKERY